MLKSERGSVLVIGALIVVSLFVLTALVVDVGQLYMVKSRLQTAADASAFAGARTLAGEEDQAEALHTAATYVQQNVQGEYSYTPQVNPDNRINTFRSTISQNVNLFFAPIIGINSQLVTARATAAASTVIAMTGVVPFGVEQQQFKYKQQYILKYGAGDKPVNGGNYGAVALGGNGANRYRDNIKYGYQGELKVGDNISTEPGNMAGPTDQGVSHRKSQCTAGCSANTQIEANCPRVIITPVINALPPGGRGSVEVVGFAAFFLEETRDSISKGQKDVVGRFLKWSAVGESGQGQNFGVVTVKLIE